MNVTYYLVFQRNAQNIEIVITHQSYKVVLITVAEEHSSKTCESYCIA